MPLAIFGLNNWILVLIAGTFLLSLVLLIGMFVALKSEKLGKKPGEQ